MSGKTNKAQKATKAEEAALADSQIFGGAPVPPAPQGDEVGVVNPSTPTTEPTSTQKSVPVQQDGITMSREQFNELMGRMSDLERMALTSQRANDPTSIFNPLAEVKEDLKLHVVFHGDLLVVGYKEKRRPNGSVTYTWLAKNSDNIVRTYVTLLLKNVETGDVTEETVDLLEFLEAAVPMQATIKKRQDIGGVIEHGLVNQMTWNGSTLVATDRQVMTGALEQRFLFDVELNGKIYQVTEQVVNIKS